MNDKQLRLNVVDELDFEPSIDSADIGVSAENGVVTLSGHVPSYAQKIAAEHAVWRVKGVKAIAQEIEVRVPSDKKHHDDEIAQRAISILNWDSAVPANAIQVKVQHGFVTLSGQVNWHYQRTAAEAAMRKLSGVIGVINHIGLMPVAQSRDIKKGISDALTRHAALEADRIEVAVLDGGKVTIDGEVDNWDQWHAVEHAVWSIPGVQNVANHLRIA